MKIKHKASGKTYEVAKGTLYPKSAYDEVPAKKAATAKDAKLKEETDQEAAKKAEAEKNAKAEEKAQKAATAKDADKSK